MSLDADVTTSQFIGDNLIAEPKKVRINNWLKLVALCFFWDELSAKYRVVLAGGKAGHCVRKSCKTDRREEVEGKHVEHPHSAARLSRAKTSQLSLYICLLLTWFITSSPVEYHWKYGPIGSWHIERKEWRHADAATAWCECEWNAFVSGCSDATSETVDQTDCKELQRSHRFRVPASPSQWKGTSLLPRSHSSFQVKHGILFLSDLKNYWQRRHVRLVHFERIEINFYFNSMFHF